MSNSKHLKLIGAPGSPYTRKMLALLRFRRIPYAVIWGSPANPPQGLPRAKVALHPTFYFENGGSIEAVVDSTPIIRRLEGEYSGRSVIPGDPALAFLNYLIEDFADEWLTKAMFHYRWAHEEDARHAGRLIVYWFDPSLPPDQAQALCEQFSTRQIQRLGVVGSNETTGPIIEKSYRRIITLLDQLLQQQAFTLGNRPCSADFALLGQLTQLVGVEPTSAAQAFEISPRVCAWVDRLEDYSGYEPGDDDWQSLADAGATLGDLLGEIGRVYAPCLLANGAALQAGEKTFETRLDGETWRQDSFPYQGKCLTWIRQEYAALPEASRGELTRILNGSGCNALFE